MKNEILQSLSVVNKTRIVMLVEYKNKICIRYVHYQISE